MAKFTVNMISYSLTRAVDITVVIPSVTIPEIIGVGGVKPEELRHTPKAEYPVLYLLHGMGNNHLAWTAYTNVELYAEEHQIAVVMPSGENKSYADQPRGDSFFRFISQELPDFVCGMFPVSRKPEHSYLAGLSMGGYGTWIHGLANPEQYAAIGAFSAATHVNPLDGVGRNTAASPRAPEHDPYTLAAKLVAGGRALPKTYIACGEEDFLFEDNLKFRDELQRLGADLTWVQRPGFGHEWRFWDEQVEAFLEWIPRTDIYAGKKRKV